MRGLGQADAADVRWPDDAFRDACTAFYSACRRTAAEVMRAFALALDVPADFFDSRHTGRTQTLRLLHYPPSRARRANQLGAGAHTDYGTLTLLFQDDSGGLEVRDTGGRWVAATPMAGTVVVNTGDLLARWTNDRYRSTPHRVQVRPAAAARGRQSIAFFSDPDPDVLVETIESCRDPDGGSRYEPITAGAFIDGRIAASLRAPT